MGITVEEHYEVVQTRELVIQTKNCKKHIKIDVLRPVVDANVVFFNYSTRAYELAETSAKNADGDMVDINFWGRCYEIPVGKCSTPEGALTQAISALNAHP